MISTDKLRGLSNEISPGTLGGRGRCPGEESKAGEGDDGLGGEAELVGERGEHGVWLSGYSNILLNNHPMDVKQEIQPIPVPYLPETEEEHDSSLDEGEDHKRPRLRLGELLPCTRHHCHPADRLNYAYLVRLIRCPL